MAGINEDRERHVVPLWRTIATTASRGELTSTKAGAPNQFDDGAADTLRRDWEENPILFVATDFVTVALTLGKFGIATDAAEAILADKKSNTSAREVAELYLNKGIGPTNTDTPAFVGASEHLVSHATESAFYGKIRALKTRLITYPNNPLLWCDLALLYTSLGVHEKAEKAITAAVSLAPQNRYILRSASRFYLHIGQKDRAHRVLRDAPNLKADPWVLSAEIATAAAIGRTSRNIKVAQRMLELGRCTMFHLSELASALGTLESINGKMKSARELISKSLEDPAENAVAQAAWLHRTNDKIGRERDSSQSHEANAWFQWRDAKWRPALTHALKWYSDQPFSSRPAMLASHLASVLLEDYGTGIILAKQGLLSNPDDFTLQNMLAFSYARSGKVEDAAKVYRHVDYARLDVKQRIVWLATWGLIAFRDNNPSVGRQLYSKAIELGKQVGDIRESLARVYYALEEMRIGAADARQIQKEALDGAVVLTDPSLTVVVQRLKTATPGAGLHGNLTPLCTGPSHLKLVY